AEPASPPPVAAASATVPPTPAATGITPLRDMPDTYRAQFPVRTLDVHVYDPDPARRWIMIDGRRYGEGQTLDSGPRVAQITDGGVVFDFQNALVLLPVR
ncbi:MAG: general secretion pathway protein GspB, partial [Solimonas sp.]